MEHCYYSQSQSWCVLSLPAGIEDPPTVCLCSFPPLPLSQQCPSPPSLDWSLIYISLPDSRPEIPMAKSTRCITQDFDRKQMAKQMAHRCPKTGTIPKGFIYKETVYIGLGVGELQGANGSPAFTSPKSKGIRTGRGYQNLEGESIVESRLPGENSALLLRDSTSPRGPPWKETKEVNT